MSGSDVVGAVTRQFYRTATLPYELQRNGADKTWRGSQEVYGRELRR